MPHLKGVGCGRNWVMSQEEEWVSETAVYRHHRYIRLDACSLCVLALLPQGWLCYNRLDVASSSRPKLFIVVYTKYQELTFNPLTVRGRKPSPGLQHGFIQPLGYIWTEQTSGSPVFLLGLATLPPIAGAPLDNCPTQPSPLKFLM